MASKSRNRIERAGEPASVSRTESMSHVIHIRTPILGPILAVLPISLASILQLSPAVVLSAAAQERAHVTPHESSQEETKLVSHLRLGFTFPLPSGYVETALPLGDEWMVLRFERKRDDNDKKQTEPASLAFVWIDDDPDPPPAAEPERESTPRRSKKAPPMPAPPAPAINTFDRYAQRALAPLTLGESTDGSERPDYAVHERQLLAKNGEDMRPAGWAYECRSASRTIAIVGACASDDLERELPRWRKMATGLQLVEPIRATPEELAQRYADHTWIDEPRRLRARRRLLPGWKMEDAEHYIVVWDAQDSSLIREMLRTVEVMRAEYARLYPCDAPVESLDTIRVCASKDEYLAWGGRPDTDGGFDAAAREILLYDLNREGREHARDDRDTLGSLYREAFHAHVHEVLRGLEPHPWFGEGQADIFAAAVVGEGRVQPIGPSGRHAMPIRNAVFHAKSIPWKEFIRCDRATLEEDRELGYAQAWSMVWFLRTSPAVAKTAAWSKILPTYLDTLKSSWAGKLAELESAGRAHDDEGRSKAGAEARERALSAAFEGVDLHEIEWEWKDFVRKK